MRCFGRFADNNVMFFNRNYLYRKRVIDDFSDEMINTINKNYGMLIPNNAVFEGGVIING